jgi:hypothetical protein
VPVDAKQAGLSGESWAFNSILDLPFKFFGGASNKIWRCSLYVTNEDVEAENEAQDNPSLD